jgi:hypothetical protein
MFENFIKTQEWQDLKDTMRAEFANTPLKIKTENLSAERIAIEVRASQLAYEKLDKFIKKLDRQAKSPVKPEVYR